MVAGVLRVIINVVIKTLLLMLFNVVGWVELDPTTPHHGAGWDWLLAALFGLIFAIVTMMVLEGLFGLQVRTHGRSLLLLPAAGWVLLLILLAMAPKDISVPNLLSFFVVGTLLSLSLPFASRRGKQLVVITGEQPPNE